jgi:hypothetical protein
MDGRSAAQVRRECLGQTDPADLALVDEPGQSADGLLDRDLGIDAMLLVEVDRVDAQPPQARLAGLADVLRATVDRARTPHDVAELRREDDLVAAVAYRAPHELLVVTGAVDVGGIEEGHAELERPVDRRDAVVVDGIAVGPGHRHAAESDR